VRWRFIVLLALALAARCLVIPVRVTGDSMLPTYAHGRLSVASPVPYWFRAPRRGDIVLIGRKGLAYGYLKRILSLPGETVEMRNGELWVNGRQVPEPHALFSSAWRWPAVTLAVDEYLVMGDNRQIPQALHCWGEVRKCDLRGVLLW